MADKVIIFFWWRRGPTRARTSSFMTFLDHTHKYASQSVRLLQTSDQLVAGLYLTTHNTHKK